MIDVKPLSDALGAEILGVDASTPMDSQTMEQILDTWHRYQIILLRDQRLDEEQQVRFARNFGDLAEIHTPEYAGSHPAVMYIGNLQKNGKDAGALARGEMHFHIDQCYQPVPANGTMLYAIEVPDEGGNTLFCNAYKAFEALPESVQRHVECLKAVNVYDYGGAVTDRSKMVPVVDGISHAHPAVRVHPVTGRKSVFVNRLMTHHLEGIETEESEKLLNTIFEIVERPEHIYEHKWHVGDLLLWDNRCTLHARGDFDPDKRRWLRRVTLKGETPVGCIGAAQFVGHNS